jgi:hypothetical protein
LPERFLALRAVSPRQRFPEFIRAIDCHWILCFAETVRYCTKVQ